MPRPPKAPQPSPSATGAVTPARRRRSATATRAALLSAAQARFGEEGYERTTLRAIAADVGVDAAMVIRYFGSKEALFAAAVDFDLQLPDLTGVAPEELAQVLLPHFLHVWEDDLTFLALLRASVTNPTATATMRQVFATQVAPALSVVTSDHPTERAALLGALVLGLVLSRDVLHTPALTAMSRQELTDWVDQVVRHLLTGTAPLGIAPARPTS